MTEQEIETIKNKVPIGSLWLYPPKNTTWRVISVPTWVDSIATVVVDLQLVSDPDNTAGGMLISENYSASSLLHYCEEAGFYNKPETKPMTTFVPKYRF